MDELEEHKQRVAFEKKYILRSEYERDLRLARKSARDDAIIFCIFILPVVLVCLYLLLRAIGWIQPGDFGIE